MLLWEGLGEGVEEEEEEEEEILVEWDSTP
jgi:hypothetical protein